MPATAATSRRRAAWNRAIDGGATMHLMRTLPAQNLQDGRLQILGLLGILDEQVTQRPGLKADRHLIVFAASRSACPSNDDAVRFIAWTSARTAVHRALTKSTVSSPSGVASGTAGSGSGATAWDRAGDDAACGRVASSRGVTAGCSAGAGRGGTTGSAGTAGRSSVSAETTASSNGNCGLTPNRHIEAGLIESLHPIDQASQGYLSA